MQWIPFRSHRRPLVYLLHHARRQSQSYPSKQVGPASENCNYLPVKSNHIRQQMRQIFPNHRSRSTTSSDDLTPSKELVAALEEGGYDFAVPRRYPKKVDLTHISPDFRRIKRARDSRWYRRTRGRTRNVRLASILARYISQIPVHELDEGLLANAHHYDNNILRTFDQGTLSSLESKGYGVEDVMTWAWVLTTKSSEHAARILDAWWRAVEEKDSTSRKKVPLFLLLFLLRRPNITASALQILIKHAEDLLTYAQRFFEPSQFSILFEKSIVILAVRLLRHARLVWPQAMDSIAAIVTTYVHGGHVYSDSFPAEQMDEITSAHLSFIYNRLLKLLSLASSQHPFLSIPLHERAQFSILERMDRFNPPLIINREGYQAIISVQLAHRKTHSEREWAQAKAKSWPPWKEDKLGIDSDRGIDTGVSRAMSSLLKMYEAGYGPRGWEPGAEILSGWDTDRSPTIQVRVHTHSIERLRWTTKGSNLDAGERGLSPGVWAARIRATRTVNESWASFIACKKELGTVPASIYRAMFERLVEDRRRIGRKATAGVHRRPDETMSAELQVLPGDGRETFEAPSDPREGIHVSTPTPSVHELFDTMIAEGHQPAGRFLTFMLHGAQGFAEGLTYIKYSTLSEDTKDLLLAERVKSQQEVRDALQNLPEHVFAAYIRHLTRFGASLSKKNHVMVISQKGRHRYWNAKFNPLKHAHRLLCLARPHYRAVWQALLDGLSKNDPKTTEISFDPGGYLEDMVVWRLVLNAVQNMREVDLQIDFPGLFVVCRSMEKIVKASQIVLLSSRVSIDSGVPGSNLVDRDGTSEDELLCEARSSAEELLAQAISFAKSLFEEASGTPLTDISFQSIAAAEPMPKLLSVPKSVELHAFVRVLGLAQDFVGILELLKWTSRHAAELRALSVESANGQRLLRRTLVAARVFLEGRPLDDMEGEPQVENSWCKAAPEHIVQEVYSIIDNEDGWGGWPTDEEVKQYRKVGKISKGL